MPALLGQRIALGTGTVQDELFNALIQNGASVVRYRCGPSVANSASTKLHLWLQDLLAGRFRIVIFLTCDGLRKILGFAEHIDQLPQVIRALGSTSITIRGPKPNQILKEFGLTPTYFPDSPTTDGVIRCLGSVDLQGLDVGVQLYSFENTPLTTFLSHAGAVVHTVVPTVPTDNRECMTSRELVEHVRTGRVDQIILLDTEEADNFLKAYAEATDYAGHPPIPAQSAIVAGSMAIARRCQALAIKTRIASDPTSIILALCQHSAAFSHVTAIPLRS